MGVASSDAESCELPQVSAADMTLEKFRSSYQGKLPVLITGGARAWLKGTDWSKAAFATASGGYNVTIRDREKLSTLGGFAEPLQHLSVRDYLSQDKGTTDSLVFENVYTPLSLALRGKVDYGKLATFDV